MGQFYNFDWAQAKREALIESVQEYDDRALLVGNGSFPQPLKMRVGEGKTLYDILHFRDPFNLAISDKLYSTLKAAGVTGWKDYEIIIEGVKQKYHGFQVTGKCGPIIKATEPGFVTGCKFEEGTWDGSDFFCPAGALSIFCTEKVRDTFERDEITNWKLTDLEVFRWYSM